jgi:hypothetical protein
MTWDFDCYRFDRNDDEEIEICKPEILQNRRRALLEQISTAAREIAEIDQKLAVLRA